MKKKLVISEQDNIAALIENNRPAEFFVNRGELILGDIYTASVENILPGIDAAFVNLGKDKMGFLHANDVPGQGPLKERLVPKQKLLVQVTKEPTGHKGPRVSTAMSLPGRFLVLVPEERGVSISRRIPEARERARLKSVVNLIKPPGVGLIIRTEAKGQGDRELFEDFEQLWNRWQTIVTEAEASIGPTLIYRDQDLLYRVIRDAYCEEVQEIIVDSAGGQARAEEFLSGWSGRKAQIVLHSGQEPLLVAYNIDREIELALSEKVELPSGGHLNVQPTEALTVIDVNSGRFTSSRTQAETVRRTNLEAAQEIPRQLRLRNIGGMVIVDFIDMESRKDQQQVLEAFQRALEDDRAKPQVGQLSDLGLVELTRRRQGQSLRELFTEACSTCHGLGVVPTLELGTDENRRLISTKPKEEESAGRGRVLPRRGRLQGPTLRAASAGSGRIQSTIVDPRERAGINGSYIPDEILEQMPDDLLSTDRPGTRYGFGSRGEDRFKEDEELAAADMESDPSSYEAAGSEAAEAELDMIVRQAEVVRQKLQSGQTEATPAETAATPAVSLEPPYSPWEAEPQNITGVFRLKSKEDARPAKERTSGSAGSTTSDPGAADDKKDSQASAAYNKTVAQTLQSQAIETGFVSSAGTVGSTCASKESKEGKPEEEPWWSESESKDSRQLELSLGEDSEPEDPETSTKNREDKHVSAGASLPGTGELNPWELGSDSQES